MEKNFDTFPVSTRLVLGINNDADNNIKIVIFFE